MALTPAQIAQEINRLQSQGLTVEQAAEQIPGAISLLETGALIINDVAGSDNPNRGKVEVFSTGFRATDNTTVTTTDPTVTRTTTTTITPSSSTTTTQETVSGGSVTTTTVTPTTYKDTSQSLSFQSQADVVAAQQRARADALRAEGKTGGDILRDPEYRRLSVQRQDLQNQAQDAKAVDQTGTVTTTTVPGPTSTINQQTVDGQFLTQDTSGYDPTAASGQVNQFVSSNGPVQNQSPPAVTADPQQVRADLPAPILYPGPTTPTQDPIVVAQLQGGIILGDPQGLDLPRVGKVAPVVEQGPNLPAQGPALPPVVVTAPRPPANDPTPVLIDETGTVSNIQRNPETGELYNTGDPPQQLTPTEINRLGPVSPAQNPQVPTPAPAASPTVTSPSVVEVTPIPNETVVTPISPNAAPVSPAQNPQVPTPTPAPAASSTVTSPSVVEVTPIPNETVVTPISPNAAPVSPQSNPQIPSGAETGIDGVVTTSPAPVTNNPQTNDFVYDANGELVPADSAAAEAVRNATNRVEAAQPAPVTNNPQTNDFVYDANGELVPADSAAAQAIREGQGRVINAEPGPASNDDYASSGDAAAIDEAIRAESEAFRQGKIPAPVVSDPQVPTVGTPLDDDGNLNPGWTRDGNGDPIYVGPDFVDPSLTDSAAQSREAARQVNGTNNARRQAEFQQQIKEANDGDWRVRLRLAPGANYLYRDPTGPGILAPLAKTDGVLFPYTPQITTAYKANYTAYDLTHSNYRGYFYQGSYVDDVQITATFTAQDSVEAEYLLAVIHFFRSATKMFYGQDAQAGAPPPIVFLQGHGVYQFNLAPCVIAQFNYTLPADVDYVRARSPNVNATNLLQRRTRTAVPTDPFTSAYTRIKNALNPQGIRPGAQQYPPPAPTLGTNQPTYVPTKMEISLVLHPVQSRENISKIFSLKNFANGNQIRGGFW